MRPEELDSKLTQANEASRAAMAAGRQKKAEARAQTAGPPERAMNADEEQFVQDLLPHLPPVIARAKVPQILGGLVGVGSLANADSAGRGPEKAYKIGCRMVAYNTESLLRWIVIHFGVSRIKTISRL